MFAVGGRYSQGTITLDDAIAPGTECDVIVVFLRGELGAKSSSESQTGVAALQQEMHGLSDREMDVLRLLREGYTNKDIAKRLILKPGTVRNYCSSILRKLGVPNRTAAVSAATELGLFGR